MTNSQEQELQTVLAEVAELKKYVELPEYAFRDSDSDDEVQGLH